MRRIDITSASPREIAVWEDGRLCEYLIDDEQAGAADTIILGRVVRVVSGMQAAFVDIGQEKNGFLPLKEKSMTFDGQPVREGDRVPVQIKREAHEQKGAFLSRDITLCGMYLILMPMNRYIGVSSRIESDELKSELRAYGKELSQGRFGLVMRAACEHASAESVAEELDVLCRRWEQVRRDIIAAPAPSVVYRQGTVLESVLRDYAPRGIDEIVTDDAALAQKLAASFPVTERAPMIEDIHVQRDKALGRFVWLKSGGSLMIDHCEAMTVIDVNSGKFTGKRQLDDTLLAINLEACGEIARQLRLRSVGGVIVIDFIDMKTDADREKVRAALESALADDRAKTVVHGFTALGLMEMTRKRTRPSLREVMTVPCSHCCGNGVRLADKEDIHG